jgi:mono/diheme cytochrome c family protein
MPDRAAQAAAAALLAIVGACSRSPERERVDFERMRLQQRYDLYGPSSVFADGANMQAPPVGTIARESRSDTGVVATGTVGGIAVAAVPLAMTPERLATGAKMFGVYCAVCHGIAGYGGSTVAENMGPPRPPSLRTPRMIAAPAGYVYVVATRGLGRMPSYAAELTDAERWAVVSYVKNLQGTPGTSPAAIDDSLRGLAIGRLDSAAAARRKP